MPARIPALHSPTQRLAWGFCGLTIASLLTGIAGDWWFLAGIPVLALLAFLAVVRFSSLFYLLFFFIPLTVEVWLPNGTVTDMPTEQLAVGLTGLYLVFAIRQARTLSADFLRHPVSLLLLLHLGWTFATAVTSGNVLISTKFALAKIWYVTPFYFLGGALLRTEKDFRRLTWVVWIPLAFTIVFVLVRHAAQGFSFAAVNTVMFPFYRNKVAYACMLAVFLPFAWYTRKGYGPWTRPWILMSLAVGLILVGIQFSYTRAVYGMVALAALSYFVVRRRLMKWVLIAAALLAALYVGAMLHHNNYLDHKPDYNKAITHDRFDDLLQATTRGRDVSTMERVYRWVAGGNMVGQRPWLGFGPGTFTYFYRSHTVSGFRTYVSDNQEGSGIHCYYLMVLVEQGFPGLLFFLGLVFLVLLTGERVYHESEDPGRRRMVMAALLTTVIIDGLLVMNDLVETDKIGSFFFLCMAILVRADLANRRSARTPATSPG